MQNGVVADDVIVPAKTKALVDVFIERIEGDESDKDTHYLVEATDNFKERYESSMATTHVVLKCGPCPKCR